MQLDKTNVQKSWFRDSLLNLNHSLASLYVKKLISKGH